MNRNKQLQILLAETISWIVSEVALEGVSIVWKVSIWFIPRPLR